MATSYKTPGVYIEEIPRFPPSVAQVETAIPAFIGYTEKAKLKSDDDLDLRPWRIRSLLEYEQFFGGPALEKNLKVRVRPGNGGAPDEVEAEVGDRRKYIMYYALQLYFANGGGPCYIVSVGTYQDEDLIEHTALLGGLSSVSEEDEVTLIVFPEGPNLESADDYHAVQQTSLQQCAELQDRFAVMDLFRSDDPAISDADLFRDGIGVNHLRYGAAYYPNLETVLNFHFEPADVGVEGGDADTLDQLESANNAHYSQAHAKLDQLPNVLPPSPAVVGVYAAVDVSRGVWKAPANISLNAVFRPTVVLSRSEQEALNIDTTAGKSINAIRSFVGKGTMIWGARTLAGNDNEWRYVPVRRFFNMVEESVKKATFQFVFEPNDANTWTKIRSMIENFLIIQWSAGALFGATPEQAFYVNVGLGTTMTAQDILEGRLIVEIGMASVRPAEFIVLRFSHKLPEA